MNSTPSEKISLSDDIAGIGPFVGLLYDEGDPANASLDSSVVRQTPLYDSLNNLDERYTDQTLIAKGGMKAIYRALDLRTSRYVAIARPLETLGKDHYDAFLREAHITARLEHPGIIKLFGMDVDEEGKPFFTMELKTGRSLRKIIEDYSSGKEQEEWPLSQRLRIILRISESLAYAHSQRLLHLDIKPDNIQIGSFGEVQLSDWGMGVVMQGEEDNQSETLLDPDLYGSLQRRVKGTPMYMAPELFDVKNAKTVQMDIYAFGCLIEELIHAESPNSKPVEHLTKDSPLNTVVEKSKAIKPSERYTSVLQIQEDISRYLEGFSMSVEKPSMLRELTLSYKRHRTVFNITLASLLILFTAGSLFLYALNTRRNEARESRDLALASLVALEKEKTLTETRLKEQVKNTQIGVKNLLHLEITNGLDMPTLIRKLHEQVDTVIANQPANDSLIWLEKFWLCFLTQQLDDALLFHKNGKKCPQDLVPLAEKFSPRLNRAEYLDTADFIELLSDLYTLDERTALAYKMVFYDLKNFRSKEDRLKILHQMLKLLNPNWKEQTFTYSQDDSSIVLSGDGLKRLSQSINHASVLKLIEPMKLDLRGAYMTSIESLINLNISEIDLRNTPIKSLTPIGQMKGLRRVIVSPGQFTKKELGEIAQFIEVIMEK